MRTSLLLLVIALAIAGVAVFGRAALIDWDSLQQAYQRFELTIQTSDDLTQIFIAESCSQSTGLICLLTEFGPCSAPS